MLFTVSALLFSKLLRGFSDTNRSQPRFLVLVYSCTVSALKHYCHCRYLYLILFHSHLLFDLSLAKYETMMTDLCAICRDTVDKNCLQCDKCKDWIHYRCSKVPAYLIIQLSKLTRVLSCHSCVKSKYPLAFENLPSFL